MFVGGDLCAGDRNCARIVEDIVDDLAMFVFGDVPKNSLIEADRIVTDMFRFVPDRCDGPVLAMSVRRFEGFRAGGAAPLAVFSSRGDGASGSVARSAQKRQRFCGRDYFAFTLERLGCSSKRLRESFKKLSRGR